jgi:hypothetical protein
LSSNPPRSHDDVVAVGVVAVLAVVILAAPMALTAWGARRRGRGNAVAVVSGLLYPFTWAAWYLVDEHPFSR